MAIGVISASIPVNVGVTAQHQAKYRTAKILTANDTTQASKDASEVPATTNPSTAGIDGTGEIINTKV